MQALRHSYFKFACLSQRFVDEFDLLWMNSTCYRMMGWINKFEKVITGGGRTKKKRRNKRAEQNRTEKENEYKRSLPIFIRFGPNIGLRTINTSSRRQKVHPILLVLVLIVLVVLVVLLVLLVFLVFLIFTLILLIRANPLIIKFVSNVPVRLLEAFWRMVSRYNHPLFILFSFWFILFLLYFYLGNLL